MFVLMCQMRTYLGWHLRFYITRSPVVLPSVTIIYLQSTREQIKNDNKEHVCQPKEIESTYNSFKHAHGTLEKNS